MNRSRQKGTVLEKPCRIWTKSISNGYGDFYLDGKHWYAHRWAYTQEYGEIPAGLHIHHICEVPACWEPTHLKAVTSAEHHAIHFPSCPRCGATEWRQRKSGKRVCVPCHKLYMHGYNARRRACRRG